MNDAVLVTRTEYVKGEAVFQAATGCRPEPVDSDEAALAAAVRAKRARVVIVGVTRYSGPLYDALVEVAAGQGALIARFGVGHDSVDKPRAAAGRITVTNTPGVLDQSVAEHALWLMGALARRVAQSDAAFRGGTFQSPAGIELGGRTLGVIGCGPIGRRVAAIAHFGLGMRVLAADPRPLADCAAQWQTTPAELLARWGLDAYEAEAEVVMRAADVVSLHLPAIPATRHFINAARLGVMRSGSLLINTARGSVVDEAAVYDALAARQIGGAGLDVFETEPYVPVDPAKDLRRLEDVVLTPHVGSNTVEANRRMAQASLANAESFLAGRQDALTRVPGA